MSAIGREKRASSIALFFCPVYRCLFYESQDAPAILQENGNTGENDSRYRSNRMKKINLNYDLNSPECNREIADATKKKEAGYTHENTKLIVNRLARALGHLQSVKRMVENERDCTEVLIQLSAVIAALNNTGKILLEDHIEHCIIQAIQSGDKDAIDNLKIAIERFVK